MIRLRDRGEIDNVVMQRLTRMFDQESLAIDALELIDNAALEDHVQSHVDGQGLKHRTLDEEPNNGSFHDRMLPSQRGQER